LTLSYSYLNDTINIEIDDGIVKECGAVCGMRIGRRNGCVWRELAPAPTLQLNST
jgi:hypothetical protein